MLLAPLITKGLQIMKWTFEAVVAESGKYRSRSEFAKGKRNAYNAARDAGMLDYLFPVVQRSSAPLIVTPEQLASIKPIATRYINGKESS